MISEISVAKNFQPVIKETPRQTPEETAGVLLIQPEFWSAE
jgi:hypothetical protein